MPFAGSDLPSRPYRGHTGKALNGLSGVAERRTRRARTPPDGKRPSWYTTPFRLELEGAIRAWLTSHAADVSAAFTALGTDINGVDFDLTKRAARVCTRPSSSACSLGGSTLEQ